MELFLGGAFQGKLEYVKSLYPESEIFDEKNFEELSGAENSLSILNNFHLVVKNLLAPYINCYQKNGIESENEIQESVEDKIFKIIEKNPEIKIISDEIGSGIVPFERSDRLWRDISGRILVKIAKKSEKVIRIICGIPQRIK